MISYYSYYTYYTFFKNFLRAYYTQKYKTLINQRFLQKQKKIPLNNIKLSVVSVVSVVKHYKLTLSNTTLNTTLLKKCSTRLQKTQKTTQKYYTLKQSVVQKCSTRSKGLLCKVHKKQKTDIKIRDRSLDPGN